MKNKNNYFVKIITVICSLYYFWMLVKVIILKTGLINIGFRINLDLFDFVRHYYSYGLSTYLLVNVLGNICLFIPFSIVIKHYFNFLNKFNIIFIGFFTSLSFELIQLGSGWGVFDIDDIFLNTLGAIIGLAIYYLITKKHNSNHSINLFLISFGGLGIISLYNYYPSLLTMFIL